MRQIFCRFLCPYARFQGVLFDRDTLVVGLRQPSAASRAASGAPRRATAWTAGLCVVVCPSDIDIRDGLQLDCIACTQCIDACNGVMERLGRPRNLIGYRTLAGLSGWAGLRLARPRVLVYGALLGRGGRELRDPARAARAHGPDVVHNRESLYTTTADGRVGNAFTLQVENRERRGAALPHPASSRTATSSWSPGMNPITVPAVSAREARVFVIAREDAVSRAIRIGYASWSSRSTGRSHGLSREVRFLEPGRRHHERLTPQPPRPDAASSRGPGCSRACSLAMIASSLCLLSIASAHPDGLVVADAWTAGLAYNDAVAAERAAEDAGLGARRRHPGNRHEGVRVEARIDAPGDPTANAGAAPRLAAGQRPPPATRGVGYDADFALAPDSGAALGRRSAAPRGTLAAGGDGGAR